MTSDLNTRSFRLNWDTLRPPVLLSLLCLLLQFWPGVEALRYERDLLADQPWRMISGHFVHLDFMHWLVNGLGAILAWVLFAGILPHKVAAVFMLGSAPAVSSAFYLLNPGIGWYVGLSGILYGYCAAGSLYGMVYAPERRRFYTVLLTIIFLKLTWEYISGGSWSDGLFKTDVVTRAHLYGVISCLLIAIAVILYKQVSSRK